LFDDLATLDAVTTHLDRELPADKFAPEPEVEKTCWGPRQSDGSQCGNNSVCPNCGAFSRNPIRTTTISCAASACGIATAGRGHCCRQFQNGSDSPSVFASGPETITLRIRMDPH